jgi:type IV pilus assembly protein PilC
MVKLLGPLGAALPPMTAATMHFSEVLQSNMLLIVTTITALTVGFYSYIKTPGGQYLMDRYIIKIPYVGKILRNMSVELFCRVLGILYTSGENIDAIQQAAEASRNRYLERQIKTVAIPAMLKYGTELAKALEFTTFFPEIVISRFRTAGETGDVKATAVQVADYFEMENKYAMKNLISFIEVSISVMIMGAMIFLTYLSSETASIKVTGQ